MHKKAKVKGSERGAVHSNVVFAVGCVGKIGSLSLKRNEARASEECSVSQPWSCRSRDVLGWSICSTIS